MSAAAANPAAIPFRTITDLHAAFENGKATPTGLTRDFLAASRASQHNAYITLCEERAMKQAQVAEAELAKNGGKVPAGKPLLGVPLGIKDILVMDGVRTTCASKILDTYIPPYTATCVERLEAAGAVSVGKLNLDEFAMGGSNENSAYGRVLHPTHADRVPGGSSGGSATAVAAGLCHASLGTDTGGSVRLPASFCGIVGLKPTYGRISRYGVIAFASSLDQVGPMTHSVEDAARLLQVMSGADVRDSTCAVRPAEDFLAATRKAPDYRGLRVGVPQEYFVDGVAKSVGGAVRETLGWLEAQGAKLVPISLPHTKYSVAVYYIVAVSEASSNLARFDGVRFGPRPPAAASAQKLDEFYETVRSQFGAEVKRRIILGTFALSAGYADEYFARACKVRRLIARDFEDAFKQVDVIAGPVSPTEAYKLGAQTKDPLTMYLNDIFTIPANLAGLPGISVPCGKGEEGLPIGIHLVAPAFAEGKLLSVAHAVERERASQEKARSS